MTRDQLQDVAFSSAEDFEDVLAEAVERATAEGIDVRGAWEFQTRGSTLNWEVEIFELAKEFDD